MEDHANEIESVVRRLKQQGEYEQLATPEADREAARTGKLLAQAVELTDEDVDEILASVPEVSSLSEEELEEEVTRVISRDRRGARIRPVK